MILKSGIGSLTRKKTAILVIFSLLALAVILLTMKILSGNIDITTKKIAVSISDFATSENGTYVYLSNGKMYINSQNGSSTVDNTELNEIAISKDGTYLSGEKNGACEIYSLPELKQVDREPACVGPISWLSESAYAFFEESSNDETLDSAGTSEQLDEEDITATFTVVDLKNSIRDTVAEIPFSTDVKVSYGQKLLVAFLADPTTNMSKICTLSLAESVALSDCTNIGGFVMELKQSGSDTLASVSDGTTSQKIYRISGNSSEILGISLNLSKTIDINDKIYYFNESRPEKTLIVSLSDNSVIGSSSSKRFHGVDECHKFDKNRYLISSGNELWELSL